MFTSTVMSLLPKYALYLLRWGTTDADVGKTGRLGEEERRAEAAVLVETASSISWPSTTEIGGDNPGW
jgi:hypothetical protein